MSKLRGPVRPDVEIVERHECYQGFFRLEKYRLRHRLYNGEMSGIISRELLERGHAAALLPYDPVRDEVVMLEQFRIGALQEEGGPWLPEIVAGMIGPGETPEDVVRREAIEEAGCIVHELEPICEYLVSPGSSSERMSLFCGRVDSNGVGGIHGLDEEGEDILARAIPFAEFLEGCQSGRINTAIPIIAAYWLATHRERLRRDWVVE
jgi:ADP-ribose pyrophosphatase